MEGSILTFGEIMLRLSPPGFQRLNQGRFLDMIHGGGEANVAATLANFGEPVDFITRLPKNELGEACISFLRQYGIGTRKIVRGGERLGIIVDRVGSGDAFMGGLIYGMRRFPEDPQRVLDFALSSSYLKHSVFGDFNLVSVNDVEKNMNSDVSGRVSR